MVSKKSCENCNEVLIYCSLSHLQRIPLSGRILDQLLSNPDFRGQGLKTAAAGTTKSCPVSFPFLQVYRHGDRAPTHIYPADPYQEDVWPQGLGMLTQVS